MNPIEIFEYKQQWMSGDELVEIIVGDKSKVIEVCKRLFNPQCWKLIPYYCSDNGHLLCFENQECYMKYIEEVYK